MKRRVGQDAETVVSESIEQEVRAELKLLLESAAFRTSKRCRAFLEHVVERTLKGRNDSLKERSIGVELFELAPDFDTGQHTIVRVTANEVRKKLAQHYLAQNGTRHVVQIDLPPGSYSADFKWQPGLEEVPVDAPLPDKPPTGPAIATPNSARSEWPIRASLALAVVVIAVVVAVFLWRISKPASSAARASSTVVSSSPPAVLPANGEVRMIVGATDFYTDRNGKRWTPDRYFTGGSVRVHPTERVFRTLDPDIYRHLRTGEFRYDIPLKLGSYELHLHFAETGLADFISAESSGEGQRLFRVNVNGQRILDYFDVVADAAGPNIANERIFRNVSPAEDGLLHLSFESLRGTAMLSGIEIMPMSSGRVRPIRIRAGWLSSWQDSQGNEWQGDRYFMGGNALVRRTNPVQAANAISTDMALYTSERWGHFSYALPVADGRYRVILKLSEGHYGTRNTGVGGVGSRLFDVYCNGVALVRGIDIAKEAGGEGRPTDRTFSGIRPSAQGKILLTFVPIKGMACVNGIEVIEEN